MFSIWQMTHTSIHNVIYALNKLERKLPQRTMGACAVEETKT